MIFLQTLKCERQGRAQNPATTRIRMKTSKQDQYKINSKPAVNNKARGTRKTARNPVIYRTSNKSTFRARKSAASLKLAFGNRGKDSLWPFRARKSAASLKPQSFLSYWSVVVSLPRSKERGFIEADTLNWSINTAPILPRSKERGFIEALSPVFSTNAFFNLPRSKERGFIEARRTRACL